MRNRKAGQESGMYEDNVLPMRRAMITPPSRRTGDDVPVMIAPGYEACPYCAGIGCHSRSCQYPNHLRAVALDAIAARQKRRAQRRERVVLAGAAFAAGACIAAAVTHTMGRLGR